MKIIALFLLSGTAFASGDAHGAGPADLIPAAINLIILFSFIIYKTKGLLSQSFKDKAGEIKGMVEAAASKAKEAEAMMVTQKKKMENSKAEIKSLEADADEFLQKFKTDYKVEIAQRIIKLKEDAAQKIETEKSELLEALNSELLDQVINKTKMKLRADSSLGNEATSKIIEGISQ